MKAFSPSDFAVLIGIDWADQKHDICEILPNQKTPKFYVISSNPKAIHEWANQLKTRFPGQKIAVACELKKGPLIYALEKYDHIVLFPINPVTVSQVRKAFANSGAKDDPSDAFIIAQLIERNMDKFMPLEADKPAIRAIARLVEGRRKFVQNRVKLTNRIVSLLKEYYPQPIEWFKEKDTEIFCDFITQWPTLERAQQARPSSLLKFFNAHNAHYPERNQQRVEQIKSAISLTQDQGIIAPNTFMVIICIEQLRLLIRAITVIDKEIKRRYKEQKDRVIFDSFPGAGPQLAPRLLVAFGTNRDRYNNAAELQKYAGIAPVIERSGKKSWTHWRYSCPKFLRQTFIEWAGLSVRFSFWAKAFYQQQIEKGKPHNTAIRALAFKWIRIAFCCWKTNTPYDETKYLNALKTKGSQLLNYAVHC